MVPSNLKIGEWTYEATGLGKKTRNKQTKFPQHKKNHPKTENQHQHHHNRNLSSGPLGY